MSDQRSTKRGGYYWFEGKPYPSVTQIIDVLDKKALRYWFGKEVYRAFAADPTLSEKDALAAPFKVSSDAKARGTTVHSIVESYKRTEKSLDNIPEQFRGYAKAFYQWTTDNHVEISEHERTVCSHKHGYAGTLDMLATINGTGKPTIVDCKTGKDIYSEAFLQLAAYQQALKEEGVEVAGTAVLLLCEDGSYKYQTVVADLFRQFFACKVLWEWQNGDELAQMRKRVENGGTK